MITRCEYCNREVEFLEDDILTIKNSKYIEKHCKCFASIKVYSGDGTKVYVWVSQQKPEQKTSFAGLKISLTYILTFLWVVSVTTVLFQPFYDHSVSPVWLNTSLIFFIIMTYVRFYR